MHSLFCSIVIALILLSSCGSHNEKSTASAVQKPSPPTPTSDLSGESQAQFLDMMKPYYELKEALVATDAAKADAAASRLMQAAEDTRRLLATKAGKPSPATDTLATMMKNTEALINLKDETCEKKRAFFEKISDELFAAASVVHLKNSGAYRQFCPMAFNDKGAHWLSDNAEIRNPYFGKKMLECGEVQDSL